MERFADSVEATEFFDKLQEMLNDPRAREWLQATDANYGTSTEADFVQAKKQIGYVLTDLDQCN